MKIIHGPYKMNFWDEKEAKRLLQELPFYNHIFVKPRNKRLQNIDFLYKFIFYKELSIEKIPKEFKRYARSYNF